ncbi:MAG: hypothetical protein R2883_01250 [Caldisericia bacterium]
MDYYDASGYYVSELSTPKGTDDFEAGVFVENYVDLLDFGSLETAIMVHFEQNLGEGTYLFYTTVRQTRLHMETITIRC